jgi:precorrin-6A/cobalt-precorrin-6A reductase
MVSDEKRYTIHTTMKRVLLLGGTGDAAVLATRIAQVPDFEVITSLAGRIQNPPYLSSPTRVGGFGGVVGLVNYLRGGTHPLGNCKIDLLIDATHPFAAQISWHAAIAAEEVGIPHLMFLRSAWEQTRGDRWLQVANMEEAATALSGLAQRVFLAIGKQDLATFANLRDIWFLMRAIDPPEPDEPIPQGKLLLSRGPFMIEDERSLLMQYEIGAIVTKNSGGGATYAKIAAARELELPVVMIERPPIPFCEQVNTIEEVLTWLVEGRY